MQRRNLLRSIGALGTSLTLSDVSVASAKGVEEHRTLDVDVRSILRSDQVQSLLEALGHPAPGRASLAGDRDDSHVTIDSAGIRTEVVTATDGPEVTVTTIPTNLGDATAVAADGKLASVTNFEFADDLGANEKRRLDVAADVGWPDGASAMLVGTATDAYFMRETTATEDRRLADATGSAVGRAAAVVGDDWSGYSVYPDVDGAAALDGDGFKVSTSFEVTGRVEAATPGSSDLTAQGCDLKLVECLSVMIPLPTPCIACGVACTGGQTIPAVGQAACVVCLLATCGAVVAVYGACAGVQDCV